MVGLLKRWLGFINHKRLGILLLIFCLCLYSSNSLIAKSVCFCYPETYPDKFPCTTCQFLSSVIPDLSITTSFPDFSNHYDLLYFAGYGSLDGFWLDTTGKSKIPWCYFRSYNSTILIIDACYSGQVFLCSNSFVPSIIISSTGPFSLSANVPLPQTSFTVSTLSYMLYCLLTGACQDFSSCSISNFDPQVCQFSIWFYLNTINSDTFYYLSAYKDFHPIISIGFAWLNGEPWRY